MRFIAFAIVALSGCGDIDTQPIDSTPDVIDASALPTATAICTRDQECPAWTVCDLGQCTQRECRMNVDCGLEGRRCVQQGIRICMRSEQ